MTDLVDRLIKIRKSKLLKRYAYYKLKRLGIEIPNEVIIGKNVKLVHWANGLVIHPDTIIEDNVKIYQNVTIGRADIYQDFEYSNFKKIIIKNGAILCAGAKILCKEGNLIIGKNSVIGANSVLFNSTGENEIWAGIPAKLIGYVELKD